MCDDVVVKRNGHEIIAKTKGQLHAALGVEPVPVSDVWWPHHCLCPCDLDATAKAAGMVLSRDGYVDWVMEPIGYQEPGRSHVSNIEDAAKDFWATNKSVR